MPRPHTDFQLAVSGHLRFFTNLLDSQIPPPAPKMDGHRVSVAYVSIRSNLVNLPSSLSNLLFNANIKIQDVIIEMVASNKRYYAGWSGMSSSSLKVVDLDPIFAQSLGLNEKDPVTLNIKINNYEATQIFLEPVSLSDWELVELHAQVLEDKLLSQTRCVSVDQVLVVYPSQTSSARLLVTDIGSKDHKYAKISPMCEVAIAPKLKPKKTTSIKSSKSSKTKTSDTPSAPSVLKRGIPLPHLLFESEPAKVPSCYEVYVNFNEVVSSLSRLEYVSVSVVPGPNSKQNTVEGPLELPDDPNNKDKDFSALKESKRIVAKLVSYSRTPKNSVGLSRNLAVALNVEDQLGLIIALRPAPASALKRPTTVIVHPYITQTKLGSLSLNSAESKAKVTELAKSISEKLTKDGFFDSPVTNYAKVPAVPGLLPNGGLLKFKKNDDIAAWVKPSSTGKVPKVEIGPEVLRNMSFIETSIAPQTEEEAYGLYDTIEDTVQSILTSQNSGTLVYGNSGAGKSLFLRLVARQVAARGALHTKYVSCDTIMNENFTQLLAGHIAKWIQECSWHKPSLLVLDNLDKILTAEAEHTDSTTSKQLTEFLLLHLLGVHEQSHSNLSVLVSAASKEALNKLLFQSHLIENYVHLKAPDKATRTVILEKYVVEKLGCTLAIDIMDIVSETEGYLPNDLKILSDRLYHEALFAAQSEKCAEKNEPRSLKVTKEVFDTALKGYTPSNLRGVKLQKSSVNWSDIGGLGEAKNVLLETLEWPTKYAPIFANCPLRLRSGILLYGYPGCGKTLLASAVAGQCGLNFISIKGPEILNKYIGASEQSVRELFERAQSAKPCILFFDEFDSIAPKRGHDSTGVTDRVVNQMLTQMDGAEGLDGVYVLAATSRPDLIDSALLRPGRLDKSVICSMPTFEDRLDILRSITAKMDLAPDVSLEDVAEQTGGFSGADMQGLGYNAYLKAVHEKLAKDEASALKGQSASRAKTYDFVQLASDKLKQNTLRPSERMQLLAQIELLYAGEDSAKPVATNTLQPALKVLITHADFVASLKETKPSISVQEKRKLDAIYRQFVNDRDGNMPDGTASSEIGGRTSLM